MRKTALAALFAATAFATPALAQEAAPFTGLRVEGVAGYDNLSDGSSDDDAASSEGLLYGTQIGYEFQAGRAILGVEGEITGATTDVRAPDVFAAGDSFQVDAGRDLYVGGRVGIAVSPLAMVYAKAGYTNAQVDAEYRLNNTRTGFKAELDGYRLGAGIEYQINPQFYVKGEYRYSNYSEVEDYEADLDRHQLLAGVGVRF
ncbi:outer membrane immunogenic protein [Sphingomonas guangdongensis]|uniref:Outer membrane immunogenic protein n=1 Tax=Sphingomonas guangdongensis TaxID=1141890 RepID=A0A285QI38_9SPHN|nr:porin family protein [Sphingomonas guangdongensis]SOB79722.1 outer membrane immunogenic protein [Sphingomonas guangdongensis]